MSWVEGEKARKEKGGDEGQPTSRRTSVRSTTSVVFYDSSSFRSFLRANSISWCLMGPLNDPSSSKRLAFALLRTAREVTHLSFPPSLSPLSPSLVRALSCIFEADSYLIRRGRVVLLKAGVCVSEAPKEGERKWWSSLEAHSGRSLHPSLLLSFFIYLFLHLPRARAILLLDSSGDLSPHSS